METGQENSGGQVPQCCLFQAIPTGRVGEVLAIDKHFKCPSFPRQNITFQSFEETEIFRVKILVKSSKGREILPGNHLGPCEVTNCNADSVTADELCS